jgi:hypothetical protein
VLSQPERLEERRIAVLPVVGGREGRDPSRRAASQGGERLADCGSQLRLPCGDGVLHVEHAPLRGAAHHDLPQGG